MDSSKDKQKSIMKQIDNNMAPRFGHTITIATGQLPTPRAAHAACCVNFNQLVIYGGATGSGGLATDDLFLLDLKVEQNAEWIIVPVKSVTPGKRYGHTLVYLKPYLILFGGNYANEPANDVWIFNSESQPLQWNKLDIQSDLPPCRVYHTAAVCTYGFATGMMVIFGGRKKDGVVLNDMWGLRKHRNGVWDWTKAPSKGVPKERQQHSALFCGNFYINIGGRGSTEGDNLPLEIYDTETSEWHVFFNFRRFRQACFIIDTTLYSQGGLEDEKNNSPTNILQEFNLLDLFANETNLLNKLKTFIADRKKTTSPNVSPNSSTSTTPTHSPNSNNTGRINTTSNNSTVMSTNNDEKVIRLSRGAEVATDFGELVRIISLEKLTEDSIKRQDMLKILKQPSNSTNDIHEKVINFLLRPKDWITKNCDEKRIFELNKDIIIDLILKCQKIVEEQPMVLRVEAPIKIFGDIHGQYQDLMRFFDLFKAPTEGPNGDIEGTDYLFLGDYVDRGTHSLETMCLLMALKIKYPKQIHLLRGNHEDRWINQVFGFHQECVDRCKDDPDNPEVFNHFNDLFDRLPLAAVINDTVICLHGGIGSSLSSIQDIEKIKRPLEVIHEVTNIDQQLVVDILWSDPTDNDSDMGIQPNVTRDPTGVGNIVKFGPDRVAEFLKNNNLGLIIRAHECVMDGFERFAMGQMITVFSATDYCGKHKNAGAILYLTNKFEIKPYLIYPNDCPNSNWDNSDEVMKKRPPTPPRSRNNDPNMNRKSSFDKI